MITFDDLKNLNISPMEYKYRLTNPKEPSNDRIFGTAVKCALFTPEVFKKQYHAVDGDKRTKKYAEAVATLPKDAIVITTADYEAIQEICKSIERVYPGSKKRVVNETYKWTTNTISCSTKIDIFDPETNKVFKITTTKADLDPYNFSRHYYDMLYHVQAAMILDALIHSKVTDTSVYCIAAQKTAPFDAVCYPVSDSMLKHGKKRYQELVTLYRQCSEMNSFPGIMGSSANDPLKMIIDLPYYAR